MNIKIKKLHENAVVPSYAYEHDACFDLTAVDMSIIDKGDYGYIEYSIGLAMEIPEGYVGLIYPRSSCSNTGMILSNSVGVIDSGYRSEIKARFKYIAGTKYYEIGDRICQMMIVPIPKVDSFELVDELSESVRSTSGFGSSNN